MAKRTWTWFEGRTRPPSEYEELTVGLQQRESALVQTDIGTWTPDSTRLSGTSWEEFRDPAQLYYRNYVALQDEAERELDGVLTAAVDLGYPAGVDAAWSDTLRDLVGGMSFAVWAVGMCNQHVHRFCLSSTLASASQLQVLDELRHAERLLEWADLVAPSGPDDDDPCRVAWTTSPALQPLRAYLERVLVVKDWGEVIVATDFVLEGLLQRWLHEVYLLGGRRHQDPLAAAVSRAIWVDKQRHLAWSEKFVEMALEEPADITVVKEWISTYAPQAVDVLAALTDAHPLGGIAEHAMTVAVDEFASVLSKLGHDLADVADLGLLRTDSTMEGVA